MGESSRIIRTAIFIILLIFVSSVYVNAKTTISGTVYSNIHSIDDVELCPIGAGQDNYLVSGATNNYNYGYMIEHFWCNQVSSDQLTGVIVDVSEYNQVDYYRNPGQYENWHCWENIADVVSGGSLDKPAICGLKGKIDGGNTRIDMLECCSVRDMIINTSDIITVQNAATSGTDPCPSSTHPVACGAVNDKGRWPNSHNSGIRCCAVYYEGALANSCRNNVDDDNDAFVDCADKDCDGKPGNAAGALCEFGSETGTDHCNDGFDNDRDGKIDLIDPDCAGQGEAVCIQNGGVWESTIGMCCGDQGAMNVPPFLGNKDYGHIFQTSYLCYNTTADLRRTGDPEWKWVDFTNVPYQIYTLNASTQQGKKIDLLYNTEKWFYCNANDQLTTGLGGQAIPEYGTFTEPAGSGEDVFCYEAMTQLFSTTPDPMIFAENCDVPNSPPCCYDTPQGPIKRSRSNIFACTQDCEIPGGNLETTFCELFPQYCSGGRGNIVPDPIFVEKRFCYFDLSGCMDRTIFDPQKTCVQQAQGHPEYTHEICASASNVCANGIILEIILETGGGTEECCFGIGAECLPKPPTYAGCDPDQGGPGTIFDSTAFQCIGESYVPPDNDPTKYCCVGFVMPKETGYYSTDSSYSFMCFKQGGDNILAECGFDATMSNADLVAEGTQITGGKRRLQSQGSVINTVRNFDKMYTFGISDLAYKISIDNNNDGSVFALSSSVYMFTEFEYLEFDIAYSSQNFEVYFNPTTSSCDTGTPINNFFQYLIGGNQPLRWHHVIIPISMLGDQSQFNNICFQTNNPTTVEIIMDNIILTPIASSSLHSENQYCTGGFGKWISDLDPNLTEHPFSDPAFYANYNAFGPYMFACDVQGAFGWTGHQCCGDDSRPSGGSYVYEYFTDTGGACFEGTYLQDNMAVWYARGYEEPTTKFENYEYRDLLYLNDIFIGCQVADSKYSSLGIIYDPKKNPYTNTDQGQPLYDITNTIGENCAVRGSYYCFDNAWRQIVKADGYEGDWTQEGELLLKSVPEGGWLVENGNFGDDQMACLDCIIS